MRTYVTENNNNFLEFNLIHCCNPELVFVVGDDVIRHSERRFLRRTDVSPRSLAAVSHLNLNTVRQVREISLFQYEHKREFLSNVVVIST
jgi:hypothetical protein